MSGRREIDKAIAHLMDWAERPEWVDEKIRIYDRNIVDAADYLDMDVNEILEILDEHRLLSGNGKPLFSGVILPYSHDSGEMLLSILLNTRDNARVALKELEVDVELTDELDAAIEADFLEHSNTAFSQVWLSDVIGRLKAPPPELVNRDGESYVFAETKFKFDRKHRQKIIALLDETEDWDRHDERDPNWAWLPEGKTGPQTIFGFLEARDGDLSLATNSSSRYEKGSAVLAELLGELIGPPLTSLHSPEQMIEERRGRDSSPSSLADPDIDPQELAQIVSGYFDQHYREALDDEIPALSDKHPGNVSRPGKAGRK